MVHNTTQKFKVVNKILSKLNPIPLTQNEIKILMNSCILFKLFKGATAIITTNVSPDSKEKF